MKEKLLFVGCAISVISAAASVAASMAIRAQAAETASPARSISEAATPVGGLTIIAEDNETKIYAFSYQGQKCLAASTRGGSGISLQCTH